MKDAYQLLVIKVLILIVDFWLIGVAFSLTGNPVTMQDSGGSSELTSFFITFSLIWIIAGLFLKNNTILAMNSLQNISINLLKSFLLHIAMVFTMLIAFEAFSVNARFLISIYLLAAVLITSSRILYLLIRKYFEFTGFKKRRVIIVGATRSGQALHEFFETNPSAGYEFKGFFADKSPENFLSKTLIAGRVSEVKEFCAHERIDEIYFALPLTQKKLLKDLLRIADDNFIYFRIAPDFGKVIRGRFNLFLMNSVPVLTAGKKPLRTRLNATASRAFDSLFSKFDFLFSKFVIWKIFSFVPSIRVAARLDLQGPLILRRLRPAKSNRLLSDFFKFRTRGANHNAEIRAKSVDALIEAFLHQSTLDDLPYGRGRPEAQYGSATLNGTPK